MLSDFTLSVEKSVLLHFACLHTQSLVKQYLSNG